MTEQREKVRLVALAKIDLEALKEGKTLLKNISITGCCLLCPISTNIELNTKYGLEITPEGSAEIDLFDLLAESRWIRACAGFFEIGFFILESPKGDQFLRYVDYLSWRCSQGIGVTGESYVKILPLVNAGD